MKIEDLFNNIENFVSNKKIVDILSMKLITQETQYFLLENLKKLEINNNKSLSFEKTAKLINNINDITDYYSTNSEIIDEAATIFKKNISEYILHNPLDKIKKIDKVESKYLVDSENILLDLDSNKTFSQYIHATSNTDTDQGQGKLLFDSDYSDNNKNVYIISKIINKNHKGNLFKDKNNSKYFNLLPFISMINKITTQKTNKTLNENLNYFFKTALIIIGDDIWEEYCKDIIKIYTDEPIDIRAWIFSNNFIYREDTDITSGIINYLKSITIKIISNINLLSISQGLQDNELLILKQLHRLIKTIIFFMHKEDMVDIFYIQNTRFILDLIEERDKNYNSINLKNISYENHYRLTYDMMEDYQGIHQILMMKSPLILLNEYNEKMDVYDYIIELCKAYNFSQDSKDILEKYKDCDIKEIILNEKLIFSRIFEPKFFDDLEVGLNIFEQFVFFDFPSFSPEKFNIKNQADLEILFLLFFIYIYKSDDALIKRIILYAQRDFFYDYKYMINRKSWKIFLISRMLSFTKGFNFSDKQKLNIKRISILHINNAILKENQLFLFRLKECVENLKKIIIESDEYYKKNNELNLMEQMVYNIYNNVNLEIKTITGDKIDFVNYDVERKKLKEQFGDFEIGSINSLPIVFDMLYDDKKIFSFIEAFIEYNNPLPIDFAKYLFLHYPLTFVIDFTNNLDNHKYKYLKESLLWFLSHEYKGLICPNTSTFI